MKQRLIAAIILIAYVFVLIKVLVFKDLALIKIGDLRLNFGGTQEGPANLIPFKTILYYLKGNNGLLIAGINIIGNIIALIPLGLFVPLVFKQINWKRSILLALLAGFSIELTQVALHIGIFDIDDVILNGLGVLMGYGLFKLYTGFPFKVKSFITIGSFVMVSLLVALYTIAYFKKIELPISLGNSIETNLPLNIKNSGTNQCCDLCGGTGGTGQIIAVGNNTITIKRRDGVLQTIKLTKQTTIKTSAGPATNTDLKVGDRVTVIIDETETASVVLVCNAKKQMK
jgi:glycopeptide antibiotics resistance protein